jgi:hypothetical protein
MSSAAMPMSAEAAVTATSIGWKHIRWGLTIFFTGFVTGFIPIVHYLHGAVAGDVGPAFLKNMTLWWGCPAVLAELTLKAGGLGMIAIGLCYLALARQGASPTLSRRESIAPTLCAYGLIWMLVCAAVLYVVGNMIWPNFYFEPVQPGKNLWLSAQGLGVLVYVTGAWYAVSGIRKASAQLR